MALKAIFYLYRRAEKAFDWAQPRVLNIYPAKTEICLLTRRTKLPAYMILRFSGRTTPVADRVKHLDEILDRKLKWKYHIEDRTIRAR